MSKNNEVVDLLNQALERGISVYQDQEKLKIKIAADKTVDPEIMALLKVKKSEILAFLNDEMGDSKEIKKIEDKIVPFSREEEVNIPLSFSQERLWFIDQYGGSIQYHIPTVLRLKRALDRRVLQRALRALIQRHEVLRTVIKSEEGLPHQVILPSDTWQLDYSEGDHFQERRHLSKLIGQEINRPFDLSMDYMLRAHLIKCAEEDHVLILVMHHIASDGWSNAILVKDLGELYSAEQEGRPARLRPMTIQYADYAVWQRRQLSESQLAVQLDWWAARLAGVEPLELPTDYPRPAIQSTRGTGISFWIEEELTDKLKTLSVDSGASLFMTLLSAFKVFLFRYSGQEDISIGTPLANRNRKEVEPLVGFFINTLVLRTDLSGNPEFRSLLHQVKSDTLSAFAHQHVPFEQIVERVASGRSLSQNPLFQVMFILQNSPETPDLELGDLSLSAEPTDRSTTLFDLTFSVTESGGGLLVKVIYCEDLFSKSTIERMAGHYQRLLEGIAANPDEPIAQLPMLTEAEEWQLLHDFNDTSVVYEQEQTVIDLFEAQVRHTPTACALVFEGKRYNYQELNALVNQVGDFIRCNADFSPGDSVAVAMERSEWYAIAMLGIMKIGGVYVPIDVDYPDSRISFILANSGSRIVISNGEEKIFQHKESVAVILDLQKGKALAGYDFKDPHVEIEKAGASFVIYTSGSTGNPKGVEQTHLMLSNLMLWSKEESGLLRGEKYIQYASFSFDMSVYDLLYALTSGGEIHIISEPMRRDLWELKDYIVAHKISSISMPYSALKLLFGELGSEGFSGHGLKEIISAGEQLHITGGLRAFLEANPRVKLFNFYGPSETHIITGIHYSFSEGEVPLSASIGRPVRNTRLYLLDPAMQLVPIGVKGEIYAAGHHLALGYKNDEERTNEKFIENPLVKGERIYKTGDLAKWLPDGNIEYKGRGDDQLKINGYRIELGEIESVLRKSKEVKEGVVLARMLGVGELRLVAYVVPAEGYNKRDLQAHMHTYLPDYMVPGLWVELDEMPLTGNGKANKRALPDPDVAGQRDRQYVAPRNAIEQQLVLIWQELLNLKRVGIEDNFFEIGGHSLLAMRVISAIRKNLNQEPKVRDLFNHPTIAELARHLAIMPQTELSLPPLIAGPRPERIPLSYAQERLWFIDQFEGSVQYHMPTVLRLKNELDREVLAASLADLVDRHEVLRTVMKSENGQVWQEVLPANTWEMLFSEWANFEKGTDLQHFIAVEVSRPFDLSQDFLLRAHLIKCSPTDHILIMVMHHIATDGWSNSILVKDLVELYQAKLDGRASTLPHLPLQYADYAIWQRKYFSGEVLEAQLAWWETQLKGVEPLELPTDFPRPHRQSTRGASVGFVVDKDLTEKLKRFSITSGATLFMSLLAVFKILLSRYSGQKDICIGTPLANRNYQETESLVGFFINNLVLRSNLEANPTFRVFLEQVKTNTFLAFNHQEVPFEQIVNRVETERSLSRSPIFQVMFALQNTPETGSLELGELSLSAEPTGLSRSMFDLAFSITEKQGLLQVGVVYCPDLFTEGTIKQMVAHYQTLLQNAVANPDQNIAQIPLLSQEEERQLLVDFNHSVDYQAERSTLVEMFDLQVARVPDQQAVVYGDRVWTYKTLNEEASKLAAYLKNTYTLEPDDLVGVMLERSDWAIVAIWGILKAGAAYVPIDVDFPLDRKAFIIDDTRIKALILHSGAEAELTDITVNTLAIDGDWKLSREPFDASASLGLPLPSDLAYVIYTSGSTGQPKGVMIEHRSISNNIGSQKSYFGLTEEDHCLQFANLSFDASVWEIFMALTSGAKLCIISKVDRNTPALFYQYLKDQSISFATLPPAYVRELEVSKMSGLKTLITAGEAAIADKAIAFSKIGKAYNGYGPTESSICSTIYHLAPGTQLNGNLIPIGKPIANTRLYLMDQLGQLVPKGVIGELCIGGAGLARGYLNRPELTAKQFISGPPFQGNAERIYKTGDLARWLPNGNLEFRGRKDDQLKIRGYRIELGEIESVLNAGSGVKEAVIVARAGAGGNKNLVAYVVGNPGFDLRDLQGFLRTKLPDYMVPSFWVELEELPITSAGKINRKALPEPEFLLQPLVSKAPKTDTERKLAQIWVDLLQLEAVGVDENFFEVGGHSLLAMRVVSAIRSAFQQELSVEDLFTYPTIQGLAMLLETGSQDSVQLPLISGPRPEKIPLSFAQERLWFIDQLEGSVQYHMPSVLRLRNELNRDILELSLSDLVTRHEILRTVIKSDEGQAYQEIMPADDWVLDYTENPALADDHIRRAFISAEVNRPFDLSRDFMLRANLVKCGKDDHLLILVMHHIASDGWSQSLLIKDLIELYNARLEGRAAALPPLPIQYADYSIWQRQLLSDDLLAAGLDWWAGELAGVEVLELPIDYPRPLVQSNQGATLGFNVNKEVSDRLKALSLQSGTTLFMTLLTAYKVLLYRYTGQEDICVGTPLANRNHQELERLAGLFLNTLVLRTDLGGNPSFKTLLEQVKLKSLGAFAHQEVPFEQIVDRVVSERSMSRSPIFQVMFSFQNTPEAPSLELGGLSLSSEGTGQSRALFDLTLFVRESSTGLQVSMEYCSDLFKEDTIKRMCRHFDLLLDAIASSPEQNIGQLTMLSSEEEQQLLLGFNDTEVTFPQGKSIVELFREQAIKTPFKAALVCVGNSLTYHELDQQSNQLAHYLLQKGIKKESRVAICMDRNLEMIIAILGILKVGAAYVPVDPEYPLGRIHYLLEDSHAEMVISNEKYEALMPENTKLQPLIIEQQWSLIQAEPKAAIGIGSFDEHLIYLIYTSGSTGKPKGVMIEQGSLLNYLYYSLEKYGQIQSPLSFPLFTSLSFDLTQTSIFLSLLSGGTLMIEAAKEIDEVFHNIIQNAQVNAIKLTPSHISFLEGKKNTKLSVAIVGGEKLEQHQINILREVNPQMRIFNEYGPTEATIGCTVFEVETQKGPILIGRPIANTQLYLLDKTGSLVPQGITGELYIGGKGLSRAYWNRPELNEEKFVQKQFAEQGTVRLYKTGDLGRFLPDGNLEFLGRKDDQVKINGHRIELGEIETVLEKSNLLGQCVVLAKEGQDGRQRLIAYVAPAPLSDQNVDKEAIQQYLKTALPKYMVPALLVELESFPLTQNGKIDKKALPNPDASTLVDSIYQEPRNLVEVQLAEIWEDVLKVDRAGVHDDFFALGGHSLLIIKLLAKVNKTFSQDLPVSSIFESPTIEMLASRLQEEKQEMHERVPILVKINKSSKQPSLFLVPGAEGHNLSFLRLAKELENDFAVFGFQAPGLDGKSPILKTVEELAAVYVAAMQKINPEGPYFLGGYSFGSDVALEMTLQLRHRGFDVPQLIIFDGLSPFLKDYKKRKNQPREMVLWDFSREFIRFFEVNKELELDQLELENKSNTLQNQIIYQKVSALGIEISEQLLKGYSDVYTHYAHVPEYKPKGNERLDSSILLFRAEHQRDYGWQEITIHPVEVVNVPGNHWTLLKYPHVAGLAETIKESLAASINSRI